ncbi:TPA: hypothetical protein OTS70_003288 [Morganella morganii]|nr:hypothetical protein [Morganella morganii]
MPDIIKEKSIALTLESNVKTTQDLLEELTAIKALIAHIYFKLPERQRKELLVELEPFKGNRAIEGMMKNFSLADKK